MKRLLGTFAIVLIFLIGFGITSSCEKDDSDYSLTVHVTINDSTDVQNATVRVFAPVSDTYVDWYSSTDETGKIYHEFPNKVVVEIIANKGSFKGCGFAEVNKGSNTIRIDLKAHGADDNGCSTN